MDKLLKKGERIDNLYADEIKIIQSKEVFSFSLDAVLLADFANPIKKYSGKIVDLCSGNGAIGLFISRKTNAKIFEIEIQPRLADMAKRSIKLNKLEDQFEIICDDLNNAYKHIKKDSVDTITCNPPYFPNLPDSHKNPNEYIALARHEITVNLKQIIEISSGLLKMGGKFYLVHRLDRFDEIFDELRNKKLMPKRIQLVFPKKGKDANMVLIEAIKNGNLGGIRFIDPIRVHDDGGKYNKYIRKILYG